ncbi:MAG: winged helix-turn-helix transcriptional regulator, partial [Anaerolineales bacterium]|nr:winged helix-turn-helix transcriptional regulator [Anaerolineales bacterium]
SRMFKLLGHPARLAILAVLRNGEECVCHLEAALGYRQAYISQHLMSLREAGLVQDRREGPNVFYRVVEPAVFSVIEAGLRLEGSPAPVAPRAAPADCPCPKCQPVSERVSA